LYTQWTIKSRCIYTLTESIKLQFLVNLQEQAYALLRIVSGFLFLCHGTQKLFNFPIEYLYGPLNPVMGAAGAIEVVGGGLIIMGLFTRPTALICSGMSAVAYWMVHGTQSLFPIVNGCEIVALYCFIFLFISTRGSGIWSVDQLRS
jgi:putative oxidoreductase